MNSPPNLVSQIDYWNRVAEEKRFSHPLNTKWLAQHVDHDSTILDCGCGYGRTITELVDAGYQKVFGVDYSHAMLTRCHSTAPHARLIRNDGRSLPFQDNSFEAVLLFALLTCIPGNAEQLQLLAEVQRVLCPGGVVYISDLLLNNDARNRLRYEQYATSFGRYGVFELPEGVVVRHHSEEWIHRITRPFTKLEFEPFIVTTMNGNESNAFQYLGMKRR
jgi:ubiquinone/menaquinone biosynthesis C-methylase UbiE